MAKDTDKSLLTEKWSDLIKAEGEGIKPITEKAEQKNMATILENQEKWLQENQNVVADLGVFTPILVPTARRIMPALVANQIVGVQPMSGPTGYAFAWRSSYAGDNTNSAAQAVNPLHRGDTASTIQGPQYQVKIITIDGGSYADALTEVTAGKVIYNDGSGGTQDGTTDVGTVKFVSISGTLITALVEEVFSGAAPQSPAPFALTTNYYPLGSANLFQVASINTAESGYNQILDQYAGPHTTAVGEQLGADMKAMRVGMERIAIEAKTRKLKAEYTLEMAQDLRAVHNMDAEAELMNVLQYEIAAEIDRELVNAINTNSTNTGSWSYGAVGAVADTFGHADGQWEIEKLRTLYTRIVKEANRIAVTTRRGAGNFILTSPNVVAALESLNNFMYASTPSDIGLLGGVTRVGTLDGRFAVYVDTFATTDYCTVGYKGPSAMDTGVIYCPYIPIMMQKITHESTFQPAIGVLTRSAIAYNLFGTNNYYRYVNVDFGKSQLGA